MKKLSRAKLSLIFIVVLLLLIAFGAVLALQTRNQLAESAFTFSDVNNMKIDYWQSVFVSELEPTPYDANEPRYTDAGNFNLIRTGITASDVYDYADLVVKVKATDDRSFSFRSILTKVIITEVYKGDRSVKSDEIYVYEWAEISLLRSYSPHGPSYNIMNTGDEYYLFLSRRPMPDGYIYTKKDQSEYLLANVYMGKFNVETSKEMQVLPDPESLIDWDQVPDYQEVKSWDILPITHDQIEDYLSNREDALALLHIEDGER